MRSLQYPLEFSTLNNPAYQWQVGLFISSVFICLSGCQENAVPAIVTGGSMAPAFLGEHYESECANCRFEFQFDGLNVPRTMRAVCPNCGNPNNPFENNSIRPATIGALNNSNVFGRWDVVAFRPLGDEKGSKPKLLVKRIVGLPGECIEIKDGNVIIDGRVAEKPQSINNVVRQLCFDSKYLPSGDDIFTRLVPQEGETAWKIENSFLHYSGSEKPQRIDWLVYKHLKGYRHSGLRNESAPIEDSYAYNQNLARALNVVNEIEIELDVDFSLESELFIRFKKDKSNIDVIFSQQRISIQIDDEPERDFEVANLTTTTKLSLSTFDSNLIVRDENKELARLNQIPVESNNMTVAIGAKSGQLAIRRFRLFRDIYYLQAAIHQSDSVFKFNLAKDQFFVLGDNSPTSRDSRRFGPISKKQINGLVTSNHETAGRRVR